MKTVRRPPYPKWNPGYFPCSSLTPLPLSSRRPSVSFGGFGLRGRAEISDDESIWTVTQAIVERYVSPDGVEARMRVLRTQNRVIISMEPERVVFRM